MTTLFPTESAWTDAPAQPGLAPGEVHLWRARLPAPGSRLEPLLREILARYLRWPAGELPLALNSRQLAGLHFSSSTAARWSLVAIGLEPAMGVDLELIRHDLPLDELAEHCLDLREVWDVRIARGEAKARRFFHHWTRREALAKSGGESEVRDVAPAPGWAAALALPPGSRLACWSFRAAAADRAMPALPAFHIS